MQNLDEDDHMITAAEERPDILLAPVTKQLAKFRAHEDMGASYNKDKAKLVKMLRAVKPKKELMPIEKGDWQCRFCKFSPTCYFDENSEEK